MFTNFSPANNTTNHLFQLEPFASPEESHLISVMGLFSDNRTNTLLPKDVHSLYGHFADRPFGQHPGNGVHETGT